VRISEAMKFVLLIISNFAFSSDVQASGSVFTGCIEFPLERGVLQSLAAVLCRFRTFVRLAQVSLELTRVDLDSTS
jgi:hypothetical protein